MNESSVAIVKSAKKHFPFPFRVGDDDEKSMNPRLGAHLHTPELGGKAHYCCCLLMYIRRHKILRACNWGMEVGRAAKL